MEKKIYITPCMKVRRIACTHILCGSGGEKTLSTFSNKDLEDLDEEYSQW